jgi:hypothetical protein
LAARPDRDPGSGITCLVEWAILAGSISNRVASRRSNKPLEIRCIHIQTVCSPSWLHNSLYCEVLLEAAIPEMQFREDRYHRLNAVVMAAEIGQPAATPQAATRNSAWHIVVSGFGSCAANLELPNWLALKLGGALGQFNERHSAASLPTYLSHPLIRSWPTPHPCLSETLRRFAGRCQWIWAA